MLATCLKPRVVAPTMNDWVLATTAPNTEARASKTLGRFGFEHHVFWVKQRSVRRGTVSEKLVPAFPRYVFAKCVDFSYIQLKCPDVQRLVSFGADTAEVVPCEAISELLDRCGPGNILDYEESLEQTRFQRGERVRVVRNAAFGTIGIFQEMVSRGKAAVLLPWFGSYVRSIVDEVDLEKAEKRGKRAGKRLGRHRRRKRARAYIPQGQGQITAQARLLRP